MSDTLDDRAVTAAKAGPATDPAVRAFIGVAMLVGFGVWCWLDMSKAAYKPLDQDLNAWAYYWFNHLMAFLCPLGGLYFLVRAIQALRRVLSADAQGLSVGGRLIGWGDIRELDAGQFRSKGLLTLRLTDGKDVVLDAWYYQREGFREVVRALEQRVPLASGPAAGPDQTQKA